MVVYVTLVTYGCSNSAVRTWCAGQADACVLQLISCGLCDQLVLFDCRQACCIGWRQWAYAYGSNDGVANEPSCSKIG